MPAPALTALAGHDSDSPSGTNGTPSAIMPMGKYRGRPVSDLPAPFLFWWLSQDAIRQKHQFLARAILAHLRDRLGDLAAVEAELLPVVPVDGSDLV